MPIGLAFAQAVPDDARHVAFGRRNDLLPANRSVLEHPMALVVGIQLTDDRVFVAAFLLRFDELQLDASWQRLAGFYVGYLSFQNRAVVFCKPMRFESLVNDFDSLGH